MTHDDGVELTFDNIVNDSSLYGVRLYGSDVLNRIEKSIRFGKSNRIGIIFSESECFSRRESAVVLCETVQDRYKDCVVVVVI